MPGNNGNHNGNGNGHALLDSRLARQFDRLPPHAVEAEMCLLASMMLDVRKESIDEIVLIVDEGMFFQADHAILFKLLRQSYEAGRPIDAMLIREELIKRQLLEEVGGTEYLGAILSSVPNASNGAHYAGIVREKSMLRRLIAASNDIIREAYAPHESAEVVAENAERKILAIGEKRGARRGRMLGDVLADVVAAMDDPSRGGGIDTGFFELDDVLTGLHPSDMIVVAARPSMGKTSFAMNIVEHVAGVTGLACAVFSQEMSAEQLAQRMLCSRAEIDGHKFRKRMLHAGEVQRVRDTYAQLAPAPVWIDDVVGLTALDLRAMARRVKREIDARLIVIDYLQLMEGAGENAKYRQETVSEISRSVKAVARELQVPVIALSQLNRASESRDGHRPRMSDLRESGSIEQDADVVLLLHREDYYRQHEPDFMPDNLAEVIVAKQRRGPTGTVKLTFLNRSTRFVNLSTQADPF